MNELEIFQTEDQIKETIIDTKELARLVESMPNVQVNDIDTARNALTLALRTKKFKQTLDEKRKSFVKPFYDYQRRVNSYVKDIEKSIEQMEIDIQNKVSDWISVQRQDPWTSLDEINVDDGSISVKEEWIFEIEAPELVPMGFKTVDEDKIKEAVKQGFRSIPGVKIYKTEKVSLKVKNKKDQ